MADDTSLSLASCGSGRTTFELGFNALALKNSPDLFKARSYAISRKSNVGESMNIRECRAAIFKKNDRLAQSELPLEKAYLMDYVLAGVKCEI